MDHHAADAAVPLVDLENGGGGGAAVTVETWAHPSDNRLKEKQPFTWLGAAPYIGAVLAGALLFAAGMAVIYYGGGPPEPKPGQPYVITVREEVGTALYTTGIVVAMVGFLVGSIVAEEGCCDCNLPRFNPD